MYISFGPMHDEISCHGTMPTVHVVPQTPLELIRAINRGMDQHKERIANCFGTRYGFYAHTEDDHAHMYCMMHMDHYDLDCDVKEIASLLRVITHAHHRTGLYGMAFAFMPEDYRDLRDDLQASTSKLERYIQPYKVKENIVGRRFVGKEVASHIDFAYLLNPTAKHTEEYCDAGPLFLIGLEMHPEPRPGQNKIDDTVQDSLSYVLAARTNLVNMVGG